MSTVLALVPARGGSKGVPRKAVRPMAGRPMIAWTIAAARAAGRLDRVVVTTEDAEIASTAREWGADVPFIRPAELAGDDTPGILPVEQALDWLQREQGYTPDWVMLLQPTSPLRTGEDIDAAVALAEVRDADAVISVTEAAHHPWWTRRVTEEGQIEDWDWAGEAARRQDLPPAFGLNGAIYLARRELLLEHRTWYLPRTFAHVMPPERSFDVDTPLDFRVCDLLLTHGEEP